MIRDGRILGHIIELRQEIDGRGIFPLPAYRSADRFLDCDWLLVPKFAANTR